ncbi:MAG: hypothetical protein Q4C77_19525 [Eubacteriales bacterium]|nr:hypothetical protein [Eubacteriales bacterium]
MKNKFVVLGIIVLFAGLFSFFVLGPIASKPESYGKTIQSLEKKKMIVAEITAGTAVASVVIGAVPDDSTTPIANQIVELSSKLLLVSGVIVLEKALLPITGFISFRIMIPLSCIFLIIYFFQKRKIFKRYFLDFLALGLLINVIIPASVWTSITHFK